MDEMLDLSPRGQLQGAILAQMENESGIEATKTFIDSLTDEQIQQLLDLNGFIEESKIPIWDDEMGGAAKDTNRKHDKAPDRYILQKMPPRNIADDLALLITAYSLDELRQIVTIVGRLSDLYGEYWQRISDVLSNVPRIGGKRVKNLIVSTDYITQKVWGYGKEGNVPFNFQTPIKKGKKNVTTYVSLNFDNLPDEIKKKLDYFDEQVYEAAANLWLVGNEYVSPSMIYGVHNDGRPSPEDIEKIDSSVSKMALILLGLSNEEESNNTNYPLFIYDGALLPMERVRCYINGKLVESAIHLFREPPFFSYSKAKGQITTIDRKLALIPLNKNETNIHLSKYILRIINAAKTGAITNKITYKTIFEELEITNSSQKTRTKRYTKRLFEFHKSQGNISRFKEEKDGIRFFWGSADTSEEKTSDNLQKN